MEQGLKIALAGGVLLGGVVAASLFRLHPIRPAPSPPARAAAIQLPGGVDTPLVEADARAAPPPLTVAANDPPVPRPTTFPAENAARGSPRMAGDFPRIEAPDEADSFAPFRELMPAHAIPPRTHRVVDGDTLYSIAERYFGNSERAAEIFELNHDRLTRPEVLPIGMELRLPTGNAPAQPLDAAEAASAAAKATASASRAAGDVPTALPLQTVPSPETEMRARSGGASDGVFTSMLSRAAAVKKTLAAEAGRVPSPSVGASAETDASGPPASAIPQIPPQADASSTGARRLVPVILDTWRPAAGA